MGINMNKIYKTTWEHYRIAREGLLSVKGQFLLEHAAISDVIPGFHADKLEFGCYNKENYAVLFVDMRESTARAVNVGAEKTFLTMHVFLPALLEVIKYYKGKVIDIMGDGIMVFWGGRAAREKDGMTRECAVRNAGQCARAMLRVRKEVINKIIVQEKLGPEVSIGIGVTYGSVIVTKIGIDAFYDVKAFGNCINQASKYSNEFNKVKVSGRVKDIWPTVKGGKLLFKPARDGGYYLESKAQLVQVNRSYSNNNKTPIL